VNHALAVGRRVNIARDLVRSRQTSFILRSWSQCRQLEKKLGVNVEVSIGPAMKKLGMNAAAE